VQLMGPLFLFNPSGKEDYQFITEN